MKSGNFNFLEPSWPLQACNGNALPLPLPLRLFLDCTILNMGAARDTETLIIIDYYLPCEIWGSYEAVDGGSSHLGCQPNRLLGHEDGGTVLLRNAESYQSRRRTTPEDFAVHHRCCENLTVSCGECNLHIPSLSRRLPNVFFPLPLSVCLLSFTS
jgi:hypothetical protein